MLYTRKDVALCGFTIYLCSLYLGNVERLICFFIFFLMSFRNINLKWNQYSKNQMLFSTMILVSYFWVDKSYLDSTIALIISVTVLELIYMSIFLFSYIKNRDDIKQIFNSIFVSLVFLLLYLIISTPVELWGTFAVGNEQGIHKNTIGLNLAIGSIFSFYYSNHSKHTFIYRVLSIIFFVFSLLAGSRKVLILIALVSILYAFLTSKNEKLIKRIIGIGLLSIGAIVIIYSNKLLYDMLGARMINLFDKFLLGVDIGIEEDKSIWERQYYINSAIELWLINPITILIGNGIDGFRTYMGKIGYSHVAYSHCNYIELLCNHGIIGFILYYYNKIRYCITGFRIKNNNTICDLLVVFMICGMVIEYSMVSYYSELFQIVFIMSFCAIAITKKSFNTNDV